VPTHTVGQLVSKVGRNYGPARRSSAPPAPRPSGRGVSCWHFSAMVVVGVKWTVIPKPLSSPDAPTVARTVGAPCYPEDRSPGRLVTTWRGNRGPFAADCGRCDRRVPSPPRAPARSAPASGRGAPLCPLQPHTARWWPARVGANLTDPRSCRAGGRLPARLCVYG